MRAGLGVPGLTLTDFDEGEGVQDVDQRDPAGRWAGIRATWDAHTLITSFLSSVGSARRAGLTVVRIGPRGPATDPTVPRADHEALDLLDAVRQLIAADAFAELAGTPPGEQPALASAHRPSPADPAYVLESGEPGDG